MNPEKVDKVVLAICALQNLLRSRKSCRGIITPPGSLDADNTETGEIYPGSWRDNSRNILQPIPRLHGQRFTDSATEIRTHFKEYFNGVGSVPWQDRMIRA